MGTDDRDQQAGEYGLVPGEHDPGCAYTARGNTCNCPYSRRWLRDVDEVASLLLAQAVHSLDVHDVAAEVPDLPDFVVDAAWQRVVRRVGSPHVEDSAAYQRLAGLADD